MKYAVKHLPCFERLTRKATGSLGIMQSCMCQVPEPLEEEKVTHEISSVTKVEKLKQSQIS